MYIKRSIEKIFKLNSKIYPIVLIVGTRGTGKTSLLKKLGGSKRKYVSLEPLDVRQQAWEDPKLFLENNPPPVIFDEIQLAPNLMRYIRNEVKLKNGNYWLSASQILSLKDELAEFDKNLLKILNIYPLSSQEIYNNDYGIFLPHNINLAASYKSSQDIFAQIWLGSYPELMKTFSGKNDYCEIVQNPLNRSKKRIFYQNCVQNYIEKDIYEIAQIGDKSRFFAFMKAVAARSSRMLNYAELAEEACVSQPTAKSYLKILEISGFIKLIYPLKTQCSAPMVSTPKVYMLDTGLMSYLTSWNDPEALYEGAEAKKYFETRFVSEIIKSYANSGLEPELYYYRDRTTSPKEISLILKKDEIIYPIEFKTSASVSSESAKNFERLKTFKIEVGCGSIICLAKEFLRLNKKLVAIPAYML